MTMTATRLLLSMLLAIASGCTSSDQRARPTPAAPVPEPTPVAVEPVAVEPVAVEPVAVEPARSFGEQLAALDPASSGSIPTAVDLFVAASSEPGFDEQTRYIHLERLQGLLEQVELRAEQRMQGDPGFEAAVMHHLGEGDGYPTPSAAATAEVEQLERDGLRVKRIDGLLIGIDYPWLIARAAPALSAPARRYLDALHWDIEHTARMEGDPPDDLVESLDRWERVADGGDPYVALAEGRLRLTAELYLGLCFFDAMDEPSRCEVTKPMRESYRSFVAERPRSRLQPVVAHYLEHARERRWAMSLRDAVTLRDESLERVLRDRP